MGPKRTSAVQKVTDPGRGSPSSGHAPSVFTDLITRIHSVHASSESSALCAPSDHDGVTSAAALDVLEAWLNAPVCVVGANFTIVATGARCRALGKTDEQFAAGQSMEAFFGAPNWTVMRPYFERAMAGEHLTLVAGYGRTQASQIELRPYQQGRSETAGLFLSMRAAPIPTPGAPESAEAIPYPMALFTRDGKRSWSNRQFENILGAEIVQSLEFASPQSELAQELQPYFEHALTASPRSVELLHAAPHREARWLRFDFVADHGERNSAATVFLLCTDVDSARRAALSLEQSEIHFRSFTENIPEAIGFLDTGRRYRYVNQAFLDLAGKRREEVIGKTVEDVIGAELAEERRSHFERALQGEFIALEARDSLNGVQVWREIRYLPYRLADGPIEGVYTASRSIEAVKQTQGALREEQARIRVLTDNLPAQISYLGPDRRYRYCNNRFLADNGLAEEDVIGRTPLDVFGPETNAQLEEQLDAAVRGEPVQFERRSAQQAENPKWWRVSIVADFDEHGALNGTYGIAYDITEIRVAQERLLHEQQWIEAFIENFPQPLSYLAPSGVYRYANRAFALLAGRPKEAIVDVPATEVFPAEASDKMREAFEAALRGTSLRTEHALTVRSGAPAWIAVDWLPDFDEQGVLRGLYTLTQDISSAKQAQLSYEESVREMQRAMDSVALPISYVDDKECIRFVNHTSTIWHGRRPDELIGLPLKSLMSEDDYRFAKPYMQAALSGQLVQYEREMRYHDGIRRWVLLRYVPTRDENDKVTGFYTTATDIQARKKQELALQQANWLLSAHFENTPLASFTLDADERITRWSSQAESLFGWHRDEVLEKRFWDLKLIDDDHVQDFFPRDEGGMGIELNSRRHVAFARRRDGNRVACEWHIAALRDARAHITSILGLVQDVSQRVEAENRLIEIAQRDTLTKLLNRNALEPTLRAFIDRAKQTASGVAVLFLDLDHFKNINDTLGHRVGDLMLIEIAATLRRCIRPEDEVARIGGDEFMVILGHQRPKAIAHETAQRIITALREPIRVENQRLSVAASIGVAVYPDHGHSPDALLRSADLAMYKAKENGKNRFEFFSASLAQRSERRAGIKTALKLALQRDALRLYYQPRVAVSDGRLIGAEALLRWTDSRLGAIGPKEFINIAEESGLIHELGLYVFRKACKQIREWQDRAVNIGIISVNFSAHQLLVATFIDEVDRVIEETGCDPHWIEVEITETSMLFDLGITRNVIADLKHRGMHIAIDDFGTGFSSLSHLQQLDIDTLKIDQSFIRDMLDDAGDLAITRSVISLGRGLGLTVTAEGVENERQLAALREAGCDHYQGFLFSPAVAVEDLEMLYLDNVARVSG